MDCWAGEKMKYRNKREREIERERSRNGTIAGRLTYNVGGIEPSEPSIGFQ